VTAPVQYGARITAWLLYRLHDPFIPEDRLVELMADLFGVKLAAAPRARMSATGAVRFQGFVDVVWTWIKTAAVKHWDETGFRIAGKTQWLHIAATRWLTFYRTARPRGSRWEGLLGILVHDPWKPYYTLTGVLHALCHAHHLRELKALIEIDQEAWARRMQRLLRRACHAVNLAQARGESPCRPDSWRASSAHTTRLRRRGWPFTRPCHRCGVGACEAVCAAALGITSCCGSLSGGTTCCGSSLTPACPSPTTGLSKRPA
jgi:hypothetical protein